MRHRGARTDSTAGESVRVDWSEHHIALQFASGDIYHWHGQLDRVVGGGTGYSAENPLTARKWASSSVFKRAAARSRADSTDFVKRWSVC